MTNTLTLLIGELSKVNVSLSQSDIALNSITIQSKIEALEDLLIKILATLSLENEKKIRDEYEAEWKGNLENKLFKFLSEHKK